MRRRITVVVNGCAHSAEVEPRTLLSDFLRHDARLTGTHVGCEHGVCGACTVQLDEEPVRSCLLLAVQADGCEVRTVEALGAGWPGGLHPLQRAFQETHALQCGFCTAGILMSLEGLLATDAALDEEAVREALAGNLCRCTGYHTIVDAVVLAARRLRDGGRDGI
jgi:aerobic-type carbon monoxide dehydrogenase small subunit (CoxS/CutS family)